MDSGMESKALGNYDQSGFAFVQELLYGEAQQVTPYTSHPSRYRHKNRMKFRPLILLLNKMVAFY